MLYEVITQHEPAPARQAPKGPPTWKGFRDFAKHEVKGNPLLKVALPQLKGQYNETADGGLLRITCKNEFQVGQLKDKSENFAVFSRLAEAYFGCPVTLRS